MNHVASSTYLAPGDGTRREPRPLALPLTQDPARSALARTVLGHGLLLGVAADALLRDGPGGLGFLLWIALVALSAIALTWRADRPIPREARGWLLSALAFSAAMCWRTNGTIEFLNFVATICSLGMATTVIAGTPISGLFDARVRDLVLAAAYVIRDGMIGTPQLVLSDHALQARGPVRDRGRVRALTRAAAITLPVFAVFAALLVSADPIFANLVSLPHIDVGTLVSHLVMIGFFAWIAAGWARRAALLEDAGSNGPVFLERTLGLSLSTTDITVLLGSMTVLFALFMGVQISWLFGGAEFLRARTGLTVAQYARRGFFELLWVAVLVIPVLLGTRALTAGDAKATRAHTRLTLPLIALVCAMMGSAVQRMQLYVGYFGLTTDRFYALTFMAWLGVVLVWLALTVLRDWGAPFVGGSVLAGLAAIFALNVADPSAIIARTNLSRPAVIADGQSPREVDLAYLARLGDGAVPLVVQALLDTPRAVGATTSDSMSQSDRCLAASQLLRRPEPVAWQQWNAGDARQVSLVRPHSLVLGAIARSCPKPKPVTKS